MVSFIAEFASFSFWPKSLDYSQAVPPSLTPTPSLPPSPPPLLDILRKVEEAKVSLTGHIHHRLRETAQLQMRVAQCNSQLVLQHERIKLTRRRFEVNP